jgi:hypothetical protein
LHLKPFQFAITMEFLLEFLMAAVLMLTFCLGFLLGHVWSSATTKAFTRQDSEKTVLPAATKCEHEDACNGKSKSRESSAEVPLANPIPKQAFRLRDNEVTIHLHKSCSSLKKRTDIVPYKLCERCLKMKGE